MNSLLIKDMQVGDNNGHEGDAKEGVVEGERRKGNGDGKDIKENTGDDTKRGRKSPVENSDLHSDGRQMGVQLDQDIFLIEDGCELEKSSIF